MKRIRLEIIGSVFWIAVGVFFAIGGVKLNIGTFHNPGPGFFPLIMALTLIVFSLFTLVKGLVGPIEPLSKIPWKRNTLATGAVFFYGLILEWIGFLLSTFILISILFGLLIKGERKWRRVFLYSAVTALISWLTFSVALKIPFPFPRLMDLWR
jgi:putative tricarboxylic transport membrane protein